MFNRSIYVKMLKYISSEAFLTVQSHLSIHTVSDEAGKV